MGKKHNKDIVPMKRRHFGVSKTSAKGQTDWILVAKSFAEKSNREKYLRSIGKSL